MPITLFIPEGDAEFLSGSNKGHTHISSTTSTHSMSCHYEND